MGTVLAVGTAVFGVGALALIVVGPIVVAWLAKRNQLTRRPLERSAVEQARVRAEVFRIERRLAEEAFRVQQDMIRCATEQLRRDTQ